MALLLNQRKYLLTLSKIIQARTYTKFVSDLEIKKCYAILGISEDSDQESLRSAYLELVKKYHPDSGEPESDEDKFKEIDKAFRSLITKKSKERWSADEVNFEIHAQIFDIKHTAPQHRQYLNFNGVGNGSPFQREKQYGRVRAMSAAESVMNHRINKAQIKELTVMDKIPQKHKINTKYGFDRLVEDLIQEAMSKGEFDNLSGKGKPLQGLQHMNPYVDFVTHKLNQVLIENGFTPEWIMLQKEIREDRNILINTLSINRSTIGKYPYAYHDIYRWDKILEGCQVMANELNKKIQKYNLIVPVVHTQMCLFDFKKEADKIARYGISKAETHIIREPFKHLVQDDPKNILGLIMSFITSAVPKK